MAVWALCVIAVFACHQSVLKVFPGPGYLYSKDQGWGSLTMPFTGKFVYICIYIYIIYIYIYIYIIYIYIYIFNNRTWLEYNRMGKFPRTKYVFHITIYFGIIYTFISGLNWKSNNKFETFTWWRIS